MRGASGIYSAADAEAGETALVHRVGPMGTTGMSVYKVGRGTKSDIVLSDTSVSRNHAELEPQDDGKVNLRDLGSTFGTFVMVTFTLSNLCK